METELELNEGEILRCDVCKNNITYPGKAILAFSPEEDFIVECVEEVYCRDCAERFRCEQEDTRFTYD